MLISLRRYLLAVGAALLGVCASSAQAVNDPLLFTSSLSDPRVFAVHPTGVRTVYATGVPGGGSLAFDAAGNLYSANYDNNNVLKITPSGTVSIFASGFHNPYGLAFDAAGNLYVSNAAGGTTISKVTPGGVVSTFATGLVQPEGLAFDSAGTLYTANYNAGTISKITSSGVVSTFVSGLNGPYGLAFDSSDNLYVSLNTHDNVGKIDKITTAGVVSVFASGVLNPYDITFDSTKTGDLFVAGYPTGGGNGNIFRIAPNGTVTTFGPTFANATALVAAVPEPASLAIIAIGTGMLMVRRRRDLRESKSCA